MEKELEFLHELESVFIQPHLMEAIMEAYSQSYGLDAVVHDALMEAVGSLSEEDIKQALDTWEANNKRAGLPFDRARTERQLRANPGRFAAQIRNMKRNTSAGRQMSTDLSDAKAFSPTMIAGIRSRFYKAALSVLAKEFMKYGIPFDYDFELGQVMQVENRLSGGQRGRMDLNNQYPNFKTFDEMATNKNVETLKYSNSKLNDLFSRLYSVRRSLENAKENGVYTIVLDRLRKTIDKNTASRKKAEENRVAHPRLSSDDWKKFKIDEAKRKAEEDRKEKVARARAGYSVQAEEPKVPSAPNPGEGILSFVRRVERKPDEYDIEFAHRIHELLLNEFTDEDIKDELNWMAKDEANYGPFFNTAKDEVAKKMVIPKDTPAYTLWLTAQKVMEARRLAAMA